MKKWPIFVSLVTGLLALGVGVAVQLGLIDRLSHDGAANQTAALGALGLYWLLFSVAVFAVAHVREYWPQMLLSTFSMLLVIGVGEVALRFVQPHLALPLFKHLPSTEQHHIPPASAHLHFGRMDGNHVYVHTNADGLRSPYQVEEYKKYPIRVACLGDSFTFGWGAGDQESYPHFLEQALREQHGKDQVAVLNAGVASYSPFLESLMFKHRVSKYEPQVVLLTLDCTDIGDDHKYAIEAENNRDDSGPFAGLRPVTSEPHWGAMWRFTKPLRTHPSVTAPWRLLHRVIYRPKKYDYYQFEVDVAGVKERNRFFIYRHPLADTRPYFDATWQQLLNIHRQVTARGAKFILFVAPRFHHWNAKECPDNWEREEYSLHEIHQYAIFEYFREKQANSPFPIVSLLPDFQRTTDYPLCFRSDPHWNAQGNQFVGQALAKHIAPLLPGAK